MNISNRVAGIGGRAFTALKSQRKYLEHSLSGYFLIGVLVFGLPSSIFTFCYQAYGWLKYGHWVKISVLEWFNLVFRVFTSKKPIVLWVPYDRISWVGLSRIIAFICESEAWVLIPLFFGIWVLICGPTSALASGILTAGVKGIFEKRHKRPE